MSTKGTFFRMSENLRERAKKVAESKGLDLSEFIRSQILKGVEEAEAKTPSNKDKSE